MQQQTSISLPEPDADSAAHSARVAEFVRDSDGVPVKLTAEEGGPIFVSPGFLASRSAGPK